MPPKAKKSSKKKKEEARLAELKRKEEEERLRLEEEEKQRKEEERLAKLRAIEEQRLREEEEARQRAEDARIEEEKGPYLNWLSSARARLEETFKRFAESKDWETFIQCKTTPNTHRESELNDYISVLSEIVASPTAEHTKAEPVPVSNQPELLRYVDGALSDIFDAAALAAELRTSRQKAFAVYRHPMVEVPGLRGPAHYSKYLSQVYDLTHTYIDRMTSQILQSCEYLLKDGVCILQRELNPEIKYGLWANLIKNPRTKVVEFPALHVTTDLPKTMPLAPVAIRVLQLSYDPFAPYVSLPSAFLQPSVPIGHASSVAPAPRVFESPPEFPKLMPLGGVCVIEILSLPPTTKPVKSWNLRQVSMFSHDVQRVQYPPHQSGDSLAGQSAPQLLRVSWVVPDNVIVREDPPKVAWWNPDERQWDVTDISDTAFDPATRRISFLTLHLGAFALVQERGRDALYSSWALRPGQVPEDEPTASTATLAITGRRAFDPRSDINVEFEINEHGVRLVAPLNPELHSLRSHFWEPYLLCNKLSECGINLRLEDLDEDHITGCRAKDFEVENQAYKDMALFAGCFPFASSKWNQALPRTKAAYQVPRSPIAVTESAQDEGSGDWMTLVTEATRYGESTAKELDDQLNDKLVGERHLNLLVGLHLKYGAEEVDNRVDSANFAFVEMTRQLLMATRPLAFS